ncbi:MAG: AsmA family protein, partial [Flavobacteriaceae bacterium]|nr:AsmA family protein [Flavobacteriaceae bacterium]
MKKFFKILGIIILAVVLIAAIVPYAFQSQIQESVKRYLNSNLNAKVDFSDVNLSFFRSFPRAQVDVYDLIITNQAPFEGETLATANSVSFNMSIKELFKNTEEEAMVVNSITVDEALLTLKIDANGNENFDIVKPQDSTKPAKNFAFDIKQYEINNSALNYLDQTTGFQMQVTELDHTGRARITSEISQLDTESKANLSLEIDSTSYLENTKVRLSALIDMDLDEQKYTFLENTGYINQLPLEFEGYFQQLEDSQEMDIAFKNPESSFKSFLGILPEAYS